ncbi:MAG: DUF2871 domain-containing protein [Anaerolineaceae bacterium]|nr:DUF2871 domain-containing protein [Anaerolineaceae bacterium]
MYLGESIFDITYLTLVVLLGVKLLLQNDGKARLFGLMAVVLGLGDSFHLVPRVISMWSESGFAGHAPALSYGQLVTSVTMTIFYLIIYLFYKKMSGKKNNAADVAVYLLVAARIILSLMPQNNWGTAEGNFTWDILRNIPFAILGVLIVVLFFKEKQVQPLFRNLGIWIIVSFACYLPVVVWSKTFPAVGALMLPKTAAYVMIVLTGYRYFMKGFRLQSLIENSFVYMVGGIAGGVFYREFTKFRGFEGKTSLSIVHTHLIGLGLGLSFLLYLWLRNQDKEHVKAFEKPVLIFNAGLLLTAVSFVLRGIIQVLGNHFGKIPDAAISGVAGISHIILGIGLFWVMLKVVKSSALLNSNKKEHSA